MTPTFIKQHKLHKDKNPAGAAHLVTLMINGLDCEAIQDIVIK